MTVGKQIKVGVSLVIMASAVYLGASSILVSAQETTEAQTESTLQQRLDRRKQAFATKLTSAQQSRLKTRCKASQEKLGPVREKFVVVQKNRVNAYDSLHDRLSNLIVKVGNQADTTKLQEQLTAFDGKVDNLETVLTNYRQAVNDLIEVDCVSDPTGFKASLEEARSLLGQINQSATELRTYIKETIKPSLQVLRNDLRAKQGEVIN